MASALENDLQASSVADFAFHSNLFKLQVEELFKDLKPKPNFLRLCKVSVSDICRRLQELQPVSIERLHEHRFLNVVRLLLPLPKEIVDKTVFHFHPPWSVRTIGSFSSGTVTKPCNIDIAVEMPKECFTNKDYLNRVYFLKRALYLCVIAEKLLSDDLFETVNFLHLNGDRLRPVIVLNMKGKLSKALSFRIHVHASRDQFKLSRFLPSTSNLRWNFCCDNKESKQGTEQQATYNQQLLRDLLLVNLSEEVQQVFNSANSENLQDGFILLSIWLKRRGLLNGYGGFSKFLLSFVAVFLFRQKKINVKMTSYEIFRVFLVYLSQLDWDEKDTSLCDHNKPSVILCPSLQDFHDAFSVVFVDSTGYLNLAADVNPLTLGRVKHEALLALEVLRGVDPFDAIFMQPVPFYYKFDHICRININSKQFETVVQQKNLHSKRMDLSDNSFVILLPLFTELLQRALGTRVDLIDVELPSDEEVPFSLSKRSHDEKRHSLTFGLLLNSENYSAVLDRGPPGDSAGAQDFRQFWGHKSELRKFADVAICETVVWKASTPSEKRLICAQIIKHVLSYHLSLSSEAVLYIAGQLDAILSFPRIPLYSGTGEQIFQLVSEDFDKLSSALRQANGLPLTVGAVHGISETYRLTEICPYVLLEEQFLNDSVNVRGNSLVPRAGCFSLPIWCPSLEVQITLETSGKWPEDLEAVRHLLTAFYVKFADVLQKQFHFSCVPYRNRLLVKVGRTVFSVVIVCNREITLLKRRTTATGLQFSVDNEESLALEKHVLFLPKHASAIRSLSLLEPNFAVVCRLAKRWISEHMLSDHLQPEAVELIVAFLFLHPEPYTTPRGTIAGFLRFLNLLASFDWLTSPLIVNLGKELKDADVEAIRKEFVESRPTLPPFCICTPMDRTGTLWTRPNPSPVIAELISQMANCAQTVIKKSLLKVSTDCVLRSFESAFRTELSVFDVLLHLVKRKLTRRYLSMETSDITQHTPATKRRKLDKNSQTRLRSKLPVVDFDPLSLFISELREKYDNMAYFFYNHLGGELVGVVWKHPYRNAATDSEHGQAVANAVESFRRIGSGLIASIELKPQA